ncbi:hypothetical protein DFJ74DRAFT_625795 [Hyaloraphidium curvatum]|nr:hypothetical protein DFJ74DRAFT_625795 [Hyaloraphidium curvatum]
MASQLRWDSDGIKRVAIITGAGSGLGRQYALLLGSRGCRVLVNDYGGSISGEGPRSTSAAERVAAEINAAGGEALPNAEDVTAAAPNGADAMVKQAMDAWGRIDIVIANAGIGVYKKYDDVDLEQWKRVYRVHVFGTFAVLRAAWPHLAESAKSGGGRVVVTASAAGVFGTANLSEYSAAKAAVIGIGLTAGKEGAPKGIKVTVLCPAASTRLTEQLPGDAGQRNTLTPDKVAGVVAYAVHPSCTKAGGAILNVGGGYAGAFKLARSNGAVIGNERVTPGAVASAWNQVEDFSAFDYPTQPPDNKAILDLVEAVRSGKSASARVLMVKQPKPEPDFKGMVVVITGAGNGIGRAHAHLFARLGASLVLNDPGADVNGRGVDESVANKVCDEARALGAPRAVPNFARVEEAGEKIIEQAIKEFGRVDVLVSNAGSLRDKSLARMTNEDFELIQEVHVHGMQRAVRAAWTHMSAQGFGRILCTASASGTYGNFGQVNYSAAKNATVGFVRALAPLFKRKNVFINALCPQAGTRMLTTIPGMDLKEISRWTPELISPLVVYVCSKDNTGITGRVFEVGGALYSEQRWMRNHGHVFPGGKAPTPEEARDAWDDIVGFDPKTTLQVDPRNVLVRQVVESRI